MWTLGQDQPVIPGVPFYPLSDGPSTRGRRITRADFRPCSACLPRSQARLCSCAPRTVADRPERTFARASVTLLGGDRPSQTARLARSPGRPAVRPPTRRGQYSGSRLRRGWRPGFTASCLSSTRRACGQCQAAVKVHGVFPSFRGESASSRIMQFRRAHGRDSAQVVAPFVQVGTYPTRNFATLGPL